MLQFIFGLIVGGAFGVGIMCLMQISRCGSAEEERMEAEFQQSVSAGVDNPTKKA